MDMEPITDKLNSLRPVTFKWKDDMGNESLEGKADFGLIAQEVEEVFPELVEVLEPLMGSREPAEPCLMMHYEKMVAYLLKGLQEANARIAALESR